MAETHTQSAWIRTIDVETEEPVEGLIKGQIPTWLEGSLIRNGSGIYEIGGTTMNHAFDGFSVMHQFTISNGRATYRNRIQRNDTYLTSKAANRLTMGQFGTVAFPDPCKSLLGRFISRFQMRTTQTDNCSVNVCFFGDKLYAMTETPLMREIDPKTLETIGDKVDVSKLVAVHHATAHPHVDPDGTVYNMGNSAGPQGFKYNIICFPPGEKSLSEAKICASFPSRWKTSHSYYHSFGITDNYFIFIEYPLSINLMKLATISIHRNSFADLMEWNSHAKTRIMLADRKTGEVLKTIYETKAFFCFHHGNAYEKDNHVIVDLCYYDDAKVISDFSVSNLKQRKPGSPSRYSRLVLPLEIKPSAINGGEEENLIRLEETKCKAHLQKDGSIFCEEEALYNGNIELARINYTFNGKEYSFVYGAVMDEKSTEVSSVIKVNVKTREAKHWSKPGLSPSEPIFVASPNATAEDDGVILFSAIDDSNNRKISLVILNASTFEEEASVEFTAAGTVTKDFHGIFTEAK